jgi:ketol-acid reductoisomerase
MDKPNVETGERSPQQRMHDTVAYSAHLQEAMRYNRLSTSGYTLVMTILRAISQGDTEEKWREEQQQKRKILPHPSVEKETLSVSTDDDYKQLVHSLKDLMLWPW